MGCKQWVQFINVAFHSLFWDLKQCFVWVLFLLSIVCVCTHVHPCVFHKDLRVKGWMQNFTDKYNFGAALPLDSPSPYHNGTNPGLWLCTSTSCCFSILFSPLSALHLPVLPFPAIFADGVYRQYREWFDLLCRALRCSWHCLTWAGLWMARTRWHRLWMKLRCRRVSTCLQSSKIYIPDFQTFYTWSWICETFKVKTYFNVR